MGLFYGVTFCCRVSTSVTYNSLIRIFWIATWRLLTLIPKQPNPYLLEVITFYGTKIKSNFTTLLTKALSVNFRRSTKNLFLCRKSVGERTTVRVGHPAAVAAWFSSGQGFEFIEWNFSSNPSSGNNFDSNPPSSPARIRIPPLVELDSNLFSTRAN